MRLVFLWLTNTDMKTFNPYDYRSTSALHWIASNLGGWKRERYNKLLRKWEPTDFCTWVRRVLLGTLVALTIFTVIFAMWGTASYGIYQNWEPFMAELGMARWVMWLTVILVVPLGLISAVAVIGAFMYGIAKTVTAVSDYRARRLEARRAALQGTEQVEIERHGLSWVMHALKQKYCVQMRVN